jgi:GNAT superfamily N-acetyltransferase
MRMATYLRRATLKDVPAIMAIIDQAKAFLKENGNPQWQDGHPSATVIKDDIRKGYGWVLVADDQIVGTAALQLTGEKNYDDIKDGAWAKPDEPYAIIHRAAVLRDTGKKGVGSALFSNLITVGHLQGVRNFRFDTHQKNIPMQKLGEGLGFVRRGTVYIEDKTDDKHLGFELNLAD